MELHSVAWASVAAAWVGGLVMAASPCALAAVPVAVGYVGGQAAAPGRAAGLALAFVLGMNAALVALGLAAARLGIMLGALPGPWMVAVGALVACVALLMFAQAHRGGWALRLPLAWQRPLAGSGALGALGLGTLMGTVMSPCATPALAAALAVAGAGGLADGSIWWGALLLLAYGLGRSTLLLAAGMAPAMAQPLMARLMHWQNWLPGQRAMAVLLAAAGLWWMAKGLRLIQA